MKRKKTPEDYDSSTAFVVDGYPTTCVRCKKPNTAEGYYTFTFFKTVKKGICRKHKSHGGSKIQWYKRETE